MLSGGTYLDGPQMMAALHQVADAYRDRSDEISARAPQAVRQSPPFSAVHTGLEPHPDRSDRRTSARC